MGEPNLWVLILEPIRLNPLGLRCESIVDRNLAMVFASEVNIKSIMLREVEDEN